MTSFDFRNIQEHPPASTNERHPLPLDPGWDAHKVYFNERKKPVERKGDDFDDLFADTDRQLPDQEQRQPPESFTLSADNYFNDNYSLRPVDNNEAVLDALGWTAEQFQCIRSGECLKSVLSSAPTTTPKTIEEKEDCDEDDMNLLQSDQDSPDNGQLGLVVSKITTSMGAVWNTLSPSSQQSNNSGTAVMNKEERIKMYESTGVDEESSVEEDEGEDDDERWEKSPDVVDYVAQDDDDDDGEALVPLPDYQKLGQPKVPVVVESSSEEVIVPQFKLESVIGKQPPKKQRNSNTAVPLLRPIPQDKLAQWEQSKKKKG